MRKSIATVSIGGTLADKLDAVAAAGFDGIELFDADLTCTPLHPEEVRRRCADRGLGIDLFQPLRDIVGMRVDAFPDRLRFALAKLDLMARLGTDRVLVCSAVHPDADGDPDLLAEQLAVLGGHARERGVTVAFEALAWGTYVDHVGQAWRGVQAAGSPAVGLAVDTFHLLAVGDSPTDLAGVPGEAIAYLQVADAPYLGMDVLQWSRHHRCFPGQGAMDVAGVVAAVLGAGYRGPLSLEVFSDLVREAEPRETARDAYRSLVFLEEQLRRRLDGPTADAYHLADPPPPPAGELTTVALAGPPDLLPRLELPDDGVVCVRPGEAVLGLRTTDPDRLHARAAALEWTMGSAVRSPVGVRIAAEPQGPDPDGPIRLDHLGVAVDPDRSDAEVSFYRTLLGFEPGPVSEFTDPAGRLRSRVMEPPGPGVPVVLNIVVRGTAGPPVGVNQVALGCDDLVPRVETLRRAGAPLLDVPDGYYDDLQARLDPDDDLLATLRSLGILYDRDPLGGELLHVYTPLVEGRFYVELLERRGGYRGFGAVNTPIRLALQATTPWLGDNEASGTPSA